MQIGNCKCVQSKLHTSLPGTNLSTRNIVVLLDTQLDLLTTCQLGYQHQLRLFTWLQVLAECFMVPRSRLTSHWRRHTDWIRSHRAISSILSRVKRLFVTGWLQCQEWIKANLQPTRCRLTVWNKRPKQQPVTISPIFQPGLSKLCLQTTYGLLMHFNYGNLRWLLELHSEP